jgi:hypothetical protein
MVMRYFGGGVGHLKNTPPQQVPGFDPIDPTPEEMAVEEDDDCDLFNVTNEDLDTVVQQPSSDVIMNSRELVQLEVNEDDEDNKDSDEDDSDSDEDGDQTDEDEDEGEDDYGYASA